MAAAMQMSQYLNFRPLSSAAPQSKYDHRHRFDRNGGLDLGAFFDDRGQRQLRNRSDACHARPWAFRRRCVGSRPFFPRPRSASAPGFVLGDALSVGSPQAGIVSQKVQRRRGGVDFVRRG